MGTGRGCGRETGPSEEVLTLSAEKHAGHSHPCRPARETQCAGASGWWPRLLLRVRTGQAGRLRRGAISPQENSVFHPSPPPKASVVTDSGLPLSHESREIRRERFDEVTRGKQRTIRLVEKDEVSHGKSLNWSSEVGDVSKEEMRRI